MLKLYLAHRREVLLRATRFDLNQAAGSRLHIVEGLAHCARNIDEVVCIISAI